jgi:hypothetical protein
VFAFAWNVFRNQLPPEVIADFDKYLTSSGITRMNPLGRKNKKMGAYTICDDEESVEFFNIELAPPAGVVGVNYTRYACSSLEDTQLDQALTFRYIHDESSAHRYGIFWTTARETGQPDNSCQPDNSSQPDNAGGAFFSSEYRVMVYGAKDTVVVWELEKLHGTSLAQWDPESDDPEFYQAGLAIVTPASLTNLWKRVQDGKISAEEAERQFVAHEE